MNVMVLDAGNALIKGKTASREVAYPHALHELTETEYNRIMTRAGKSGAPEDYIRVNGKPYAVGEQAERHTQLSKRKGAARYTKDYYGVFVAATLVRLYDRGGDVALFGSHAPGDVDYREDLMRAALGEYEIESQGKLQKFKVSYVNAFDEPAGGLMNVLLTADGTHYARTDINGGRALVIDIGGFTTDFLAVNPGGEVDYSLHESEPLGILGIERDFTNSFRANNRELVKSTPVLAPDRIRTAIRTGLFKGGGDEIPCEIEAHEATQVLLNRIGDTFVNVAGGPANWDSIVVTGGGGGMLFDRLTEVLQHKQLLMADEASKIHLANVRGGLKLWRLYESEGLLE